MSETPSSPQTEGASPIPTAGSHAPQSTASSSTPATKKSKKNSSQVNKKVSADVLERRRLGRIKAAETMARKIKKSGIERRDNPLKYSVFGNINIINQKNYFTDYLKKDEQNFILRERKQLRLNKTVEKKTSANKTDSGTPQVDGDDDEDDDDEDEDNDNNETVDNKHGSNTIVIHPGSRNIRIGLASDVYPKTIPFVIATPGENRPKENEQYFRELEDNETEQYGKTKDDLISDFKERMKYYKRRIIPNSKDVAANFNKKVEAEKIPEHNDVHRFEYIKPTTVDPTSYYIGEEALRLDSDKFRLRYPLLTNGRFNESEYESEQEIYGEIQLFIRKILESQFHITNLKNFKVALVIPDLYDKVYVESFIEILFQLNFQGIAIIQESLAATYGAGVSSACVIDIGANTTKISCIDDGMIIPNSRAVLNYGGDDITRLFYKLLKESSFPIDLNPDNGSEWKMMEQLKEKFITFQDANITVQLYNFIKRFPNKLSEKYEFKVFDEVILAPMALFFPDIFTKPRGFKDELLTKKRSLDLFTDEPDNPISTTQKNLSEKNLYSLKSDLDILKDLINSSTLEDGINSDYPVIADLDKAIIQSIANASRYDFTKTQSFYENLLLVGGTSKIEALDFILTDRINIWRPRFIALQQLPDFLKQVELIISNFEKENEFSKITNEEELQPLQEKLYEILEKELIVFLDNVNNSLCSVEVLPAPREIDPSILTWKGGSVFARLKIMEELWITEKDWDLLGARSLQHKSLFNY